MVTTEVLLKKLNIANIRTVKQILANKELSEEIAKRDVISEKQLVEEYQIPQSHLRNLKQKNKISYFCTTGELNKSSRGSKAYYFVDEVQEIFGYNIKYNKSLVFKHNIFNKLMVDLSKEFCTNRESRLLEMLLVQNLSVEEIAYEEGVGVVRANDMINKAHRRVLSKIYSLKKMFAEWPNELAYKTENELLKKQNTELYHKFLRNKENKEAKDYLSQDAVQHFIKYGYDLKDLDKPIIDFDLSVRALNGLKSIEIEKLEDLLSHSKHDLIRIRNMGQKTLNEICDWLEDTYNWKLKIKN